MWAKFMEVKTGYAAQIWREFLNAEGVSVRIVPPLESDTPMTEAREIWVPDSKTHVARELQRKI
jgi:flavodoxin